MTRPNARRAQPIARPWTRPGEPNSKPNRSFGGLYRTAEHEEHGETFGGVPLQTAEDAAVAAVRMGYRVADEQIERGRRFASRLRGAAGRAGSEGLGDAVNGVEQLVTRAFQEGLRFMEDTARDPQSPIKRLASAELSLLASIFGLRPPEAGPAAAPAPAREREAPVDAEPAASRRDRHAAGMDIQHETGSDARAVQIVKWQADRPVGDKHEVMFHHLHQDVDPMPATLERVDRGLVLRVATRAHRAGHWRAAVLDDQRVQIGVIEIEF